MYFVHRWILGRGFLDMGFCHIFLIPISIQYLKLLRVIFMDHGQRTMKDFDYFQIILYLRAHLSKWKKF